MMNDLDDYYPTVDLNFICSLIERSPKVIDTITVGHSKAYIISGSNNKPISTRTIIIRDVGDNCVDYNFATGIAIKLGLLTPLTAWLEENKKWKDGGYIT